MQLDAVEAHFPSSPGKTSVSAGEKILESDSNRGREFLGSGIVFPLGVDSSGKLRMNSLEDHVRQSILLILRTAPGERVMRPDFGAGLDRLVFAPIGGATTSLVEHAVRDALLNCEPRIDVLNLKVCADPERPETLNIELHYRVRHTDTMFNLVYPFYLERGA